MNVDSYVDKLYEMINNPNDLKFIQFRDVIYDIFIYDTDIGNVILLVLKKIFSNHSLSSDMISAIYLDTFSFLQFYNNNYRPIYHIEKFVYNIINKIHGY